MDIANQIIIIGVSIISVAIVVPIILCIFKKITYKSINKRDKSFNIKVKLLKNNDISFDDLKEEDISAINFLESEDVNEST